MNNPRSLVLLAVAAAWAICCGGTIAEAQVGAGGIIALTTALQGVKHGLDESVNNAGNSADQELRNAQTRTDHLLKQMDELKTKIGGEAATQREDLARQGFALLGQMYADTQSVRMSVSLNMYQGLASAAAILDAIPFVNVPDTPFASSPIGLKANGKDRRVTIYGYFPSLKSGSTGTIKFDSGESVKGFRGIGSLYFDIPEKLIKPGQYINARVELPSFVSFWNTDRFGVRTYVFPEKPFQVTVEYLQRNAAAYADLTGTTQRVRADSDHLDNHYLRSVNDLFTTSVPSHADYDLHDLTFKDVTLAIVQNDKPCSCCPSPSFEVHVKSLDQIDMELQAPNCGSCGSLFNHCGGGGSHIDVDATPIFTARIASLPKMVSLKRMTFQMAENDLKKLAPDPKAVVTQILVQVSDGQSTASDFGEISNGTMILDKASVSAKRTWDATVLSDGGVAIATHDLPVSFQFH